MFLKDFLFSVIGEYTPVTYQAVAPVVLSDGTYEFVEYTVSHSVDWPWLIAALCLVLSLYLVFQFFVKGFFALLKAK